MPLAIARLVENNMTMDILSPLKTPMIINLGELPDPPNSSNNPVSQSSTSPLPILPPMLPVPPHVTGLSTSLSQNLLALADAIQSATMSPLPLDNWTPNLPPSSIPPTLNPSPSHPLTLVILRHWSPLPSFFHNPTLSPHLEISIMTIGMGVLTEDDIRDIRKKCWALLKAMEAQERLESALKVWTEDLLPTTNILGNDSLDDETFSTTFYDFSVVQHLFFVP